jgi:signal transduction histidine kinase
MSTSGAGASDRRQHMLSGLRQLVSELTQHAPIERVLERVLPILRDLAGADRAAAFLGPPIRPVALLNLSREYLEQVLPNYRRGPAGVAESLGKPAFISDVLDPEQNAGWISAAARREGFRGIAIVPLLYSGRAVGGLSLYFDAPKQFDEDERTLLVLVADELAVAVESARRDDLIRSEHLECDEILEELPVGVAVVGPTGKLERANRLSRRLLAGGQVARVLGADDEGRAIDRLGRVLEARDNPITRGLAGQVVESTEVTLETSPRELRTFLIAARPLRGRALTILQDVTLARELDVFKDAVIQIAGHELRSPMTALLLAARALGRRVGDENRAALAAAETVEQQALRLSAVVEHLLVAADLAAELRQLELSELQVGAVVLRAAADAQRRHGRSEQIRVHGQTQEVRGDRGLVGQAIRELLDNAMAHGAGDGGVEVEIGSDGPDAVVRVMDRGPGLSPDLVAKLFDRFHLARSSLPTRNTGLGLYIASMVARAHGGSLSYEARDGGGACFVLRFPRSGPEARPAPAAGRADSSPLPPAASAPH